MELSSEKKHANIFRIVNWTSGLVNGFPFRQYQRICSAKKNNETSVLRCELYLPKKKMTWWEWSNFVMRKKHAHTHMEWIVCVQTGFGNHGPVMIFRFIHVNPFFSQSRFLSSLIFFSIYLCLLGLWTVSRFWTDEKNSVYFFCSIFYISYELVLIQFFLFFRSAKETVVEVHFFARYSNMSLFSCSGLWAATKFSICHFPGWSRRNDWEILSKHRSHEWDLIMELYMQHVVIWHTSQNVTWANNSRKIAAKQCDMRTNENEKCTLAGKWIPRWHSTACNCNGNCILCTICLFRFVVLAHSFHSTHSHLLSRMSSFGAYVRLYPFIE